MLWFRIRLLAIAVAALVAPRTLAAQAIAAGDTLHLRLLDRLASGHRAPGRVRAMVIAPVLDASARVVIPPGSTVTGRVTGAGTERYGGKRHWIAFRADSIAIPISDATDDSMHASMAMRMLAIDDSRESVDSGGRIVGAPIPSIIRSKRDWAVLVLGVFHPLGALVIAATLEGERVERHRAIALGPGTELTAVITRAATLPEWTRWAPPPPIPRGIVDPDSLAEYAPLRTRLADIGAPSDVISIAVIGSAAQVSAAFAKAGWTLAVPLDLRGDFVTFVRAAKGKGYDAQPVSKLVLDGRAPDRVYEKVTDTFTKRHHFRLWRWPPAGSGYVSDTTRAVWLIAATHDIGVMFSGQRKTFTHRVDPRIDDERDKVVGDLVAVNEVAAMTYVQRVAPLGGATVNGTRVPAVTDWRMAVVVLR